MSLKVRLLAVCLLCIFATMTTEAQMPKVSSASERLRALDAHAATVLGTDANTIGQFTADILQVTPLRNANAPLRDRCRRAEQDYRTGLRAAVSETQIVAAVNTFGETLNLPGFTPTNVKQVRAVRFLMLPTMPNLLSSPTRDPSVLFTSEISPMGAVYLATLIIEQKATNVSFQMDADTWVDQLNKMQKEASRNASNVAAPRVVARTSTTPGSAAFRRFRDDLASNGGVSTTATSRFLDELTFPK